MLQATTSEGLAQGPYVVAGGDSNLRPSRRKTPNQPLSHHAPHLDIIRTH